MDPPAKRGSHLLVLLVVVGFGAQIGVAIDDDGWLKECTLWSGQCGKEGNFGCSEMAFCLPEQHTGETPAQFPWQLFAILVAMAVAFILVAMAGTFILFLVRRCKSFHDSPAAPSSTPTPSTPQDSQEPAGPRGARAVPGALLGLVVGCGLSVGRWVRNRLSFSPVWSRSWLWWLTVQHFIKIAVIYVSVIGATCCVCGHVGDPVALVQVLFRVQEVQRVYLPMHTFLGGLMGFVLSLWVNKASEGYHQGAREVVGLCDLMREIVTHPKIQRHTANGHYLRGLHKQLRRLLVLIGEAARCPDINAPFEHKHSKPRGESRANRGFHLIHKSTGCLNKGKTPYKALVEYRLHNLEAQLKVCGVNSSEAKELVKGIRTKFRAIIAMNNNFSRNHDGLQDLHNAKVLQLILFVYIYAMPFAYFPCKALAEAVLADHHRPLVYWQSLFVIAASFISIWVVVVTYYAFLESAKNLSQVFGDGTWVTSLTLRDT